MRISYRTVALTEYDRLRDLGYPAIHAYGIALDMVKADAVLTYDLNGAAGAPYGNDCIAYDVDADALAEATSALVQHVVVTPDGMAARRTSERLELPEGAWARIYVYPDESATYDDECYSEDDIEALDRGEWSNVMVAAVVTLADDTEGTASLGGIEQGTYWPGDDESQLWHAVPDVIADALKDAERSQAEHARKTSPCGDVDYAKVVNDAVTDALEWAGQGGDHEDETVRDTINLLVNVIVSRLANPDSDVDSIVLDCYDPVDTDTDEEVIERVRGWVEW